MESKPEIQSLINGIKQRGWVDASRTALDVIEPIAPVISGLLLVIQPVSTIFGAQDTVGDLAKLLDTPEGIVYLRDQLNEN